MTNRKYSQIPAKKPLTEQDYNMRDNSPAMSEGLNKGNSLKSRKRSCDCSLHFQEVSQSWIPSWSPWLFPALLGQGDVTAPKGSIQPAAFCDRARLRWQWVRQCWLPWKILRVITAAFRCLNTNPTVFWTSNAGVSYFHWWCFSKWFLNE